MIWDRNIMYMLDNRMLSDEENRKAFIEGICKNITLEHLDVAVENAQAGYLLGENQSSLRMVGDIFIVPFLLRYGKKYQYVENYNTLKAEGLSAEQLLLALLEGPTQAVSKGGLGVNSFKWFLVESLGQLIPILAVNQNAINGDHENIDDSATMVIISEMMEHLGQMHELNKPDKPQIR